MFFLHYNIINVVEFFCYEKNNSNSNGNCNNIADSCFGEESHELNIDSKSCVLMESSTGMVLYENNQNEKT